MNDKTSIFNLSWEESNNFIEDDSVNLFFCDPPYYISGNKKSSQITSGQRTDWDNQWENKKEFYDWTKMWMSKAYEQLNDNGSMYVCISWQHSGKFQELLEEVGFNILNRITWKRDKGRGSNSNWKSMHEDIWFVSKTKKYYFDVESVKVKKNVVAPYVDDEGNPKDWFVDEYGNKIRYTHPGNLWDGFTVPFWSMKEVRSYAKTKKSPDNHLPKHSTQKPLDLVRQCIKASSKPDDLVVDYFLGSGTTAVASKQLDRKFIGFDISSICIEMTETRLIHETATINF